MKWFKHFVDAHRGKSLQLVRRRFGMSGVGAYWTLVELCAEKLEPDSGGNFSESGCVFEFERDYLKQQLGMNMRKFPKLLRMFHEHSLIFLECFEKSPECLENVLKIKMPKLLEYKHKDAFSSRHWRDSVPAKNKDLKNKEKDSPQPPVGETDKEPDKKQEVSPDPEIDPHDPNQYLLPGVLKPSSEKSAVELMNEVRVANNTALSKSNEVLKLIGKKKKGTASKRRENEPSR